MNFWRCLLALAFAALIAGLARQPQPTSASAGSSQPSTSKYVGAGSCSASACHNANPAHGRLGSEFATWMTRDPHARAYEVLFNERSKSIQKNLRQSTPSHQDSRCLKCHVAPDYDDTNPPAASYFKTDGVSCESCHGGARDWINHHHLVGWQLRTPADKKRLGMNDTRSLIGRAQLCASCHVGGAAMDVDHELIAAGHPRLHFEFGAFHAHLPHHWADAKDHAKPDFETRAWLAGQLVTAHAALELLSARASKKSSWPEFAEFDCASCHHDLREPSTRQMAGFATRRPGAFAWGHQVLLTPIALERVPNAEPFRQHLTALQKRMDAVNPAPAMVAKEAREAAVSLQELLGRIDGDFLGLTPGRDAIVQFLEKSGKNAMADTDLRTQVRLGLVAIERRPEKAPGLHRFDPDAIHARLTQSKTSKDR